MRKHSLGSTRGQTHCLVQDILKDLVSIHIHDVLGVLGQLVLMLGSKDKQQALLTNEPPP